MTTDASDQNNTGPLGEPVIRLMIESQTMTATINHQIEHIM